MERTALNDQPGRKEPYIAPALTSHAPLRDITAFQSDCNNPIVTPDLAHVACHEDHGDPNPGEFHG